MQNILIGFLTIFFAVSLSAKSLVIHEWGTFTVLQDEKGTAIRGINSDDEPVPSFVHRAAISIQGLHQARVAVARVAGFDVTGKAAGLVSCHPDVTMRLETPIVYFYPSGNREITLDYSVEFPHGILGEFYPNAIVTTPGFKDNRLTPDACGKLKWKNIRIGGKAQGPRTDASVWTTPRLVDAASVTTSAGEKERYLFYRGVANLESPLRVVRNNENFIIQANQNIAVPEKAWLADLRADGTAAFRDLSLNDVGGNSLATTPANFSESDYSKENEDRLKSTMRAALIKDGLFPKEAEAMLKTWEISYFQSAGLRLFYLVPREWTDKNLPVNVSVDADLTRVMIGRIEIVTPYQRHLLGILREKEGAFNAYNIPAAYYLLGRFANALILDELKKRPSEKLREFTRTYDYAVGDLYSSDQ